MKNKGKNTEAELNWTARKMSPIILFYVALVFIAFIAISYFVFHSMAAVKTLLFTAVGSIVTLLPMIFSRFEYRLTAQKLEYRTINKKEQKPFKVLFLSNQLSHLIKVKSGFKFYLIFKEKNPIRRFWKKHISDKYSGEIKVDKEEMLKIRRAFENLEIRILK